MHSETEKMNQTEYLYFLNGGEKCIKKNPRLLAFGLAVGGSSGTLPHFTEGKPQVIF